MVTALALCALQVPNEALVKLADRLDQVRLIAFDYKRVLDYGSNGYKHELTARFKVTFGKDWYPLGAKFEAKSSAREEAFDGVAYWCKIKGRTEVEELTPAADYFEGVSVLKNSLIGLGASVRAAAKEATAVQVKPDSVTFELKDKELGICKPLLAVTYTPRYEIRIDPKTGLPVKITQFLADRKDKITTSFANYDLAPK